MGLAEALATLIGASIELTRPMSVMACLAGIIVPRRRSTKRAANPPVIVIGAGHDTHLTLLALKRMNRCPAIVLMQPTLPFGLFDACLVPTHDNPPQRANVIRTRGAINRVRPSCEQSSTLGVFLIGGPSDHYAWDDAAIISQIQSIVAHDAAVRWSLTTSRRTPPSFVASLHSTLKGEARLTIVEGTQTPRGWVSQQLAQCAQAWVTEDSVSMISEALTSGASVGVLEVPPRTRSPRTDLGLSEFIAARDVTLYGQWDRERTLPRPVAPLDEATRCAAIIRDRFFPG